MNQKSVKDYYGILGVASTASLEEIRLAYRRQARAFHPDLSTDPHAEERFKEINEAYDVLANTEKRRSYDYFVSGGDRDETADAPGPAVSPVEDEPTAHTVNSSNASSSVAQGDFPRQPTPTVPSRNDKPREKRRISPPTWAILLIILGACIIVAVAVGGLLALQRNRPTGGADSVSVTKLTTFVSPPEIPEELTVLQEDNMPLETISPVEIDVAGTTFPVLAVLPEQGRWPLPTGDMSLGMWMHGTLINYVIGFSYTDAMESLLSGLMSGDRIVVTLESGAKLAFGSPQVKRLAPDDMTPMEQDRPGLTLMLLGDNQPSRLVVNARYIPESVRPSADQKADGLAVRVLSADVYEGATPETTDSWYFLVEYAITNTVGTDVDAAYFDMVLEDADGQRYVLNDEVTSRGQRGKLTSVLSGGAMALGSAGYIIPRTVSTPLVWVFRADPTSSETARLVLSFEPPKPAPAVPDVELYEAFLDRNRGVIVLNGTVYNDGESVLTVTPESVELTSQGGASTLAAASPLLPWTVPANDYQDFELQFSIPEEAETALLNVQGFTFEIEGLSP